MARVTLTLLLVSLAGPALGQDVERRPIVIEPPPATPPQTKQPPPAPSPTPLPPAKTPLTELTPRRLRLEPQLLLSIPRQSPPRTLGEAERVRRRIDGYFADILARRRVTVGNIAGGWVELADRAESNWQPGFSLVGDDSTTAVSGPWLRREFWGWLTRWYRQAQAIGRPDEQEVDRRRLADTTMLDLQRAAYRGDGYGSRVVALVEVSLSAERRLQARLVGSSGHPRFDREALRAVRQALDRPLAADLPPAPARALYAVQCHYVILPPLPVLGFAFDESLGFFDLMYPLKKIARGQVKLVAVYRKNNHQ